MTYTIQEKIRIVRLLRGYTEQYMPAKLHRSQQGYCYLERRSKHIRSQELSLIAQTLCVSLEFIREFNPARLLNS